MTIREDQGGPPVPKLPGAGYPPHIKLVLRAPDLVLVTGKRPHGQLLRMPTFSKMSPPLSKAAPRRAPTRAVSTTLSYARGATGPRSVPPATKPNQSSPVDDLKQLM
ncbi:hypothetical protein EVAR_56496_1 [Eumeta japonica]|uniref:Uncharacterized protein n=1 Tax=Eumeta variegata TaxID=151549 RepID=A0A4C1XME7_EUMVA|nr:hypothetical protein EVAR_56496_1 [Eumeta japonica]